MNSIRHTEYTERTVVRATFEAETPLAIGTGVKNMLTDSPVATDINGLPYIPGTSLAGVIRSALGIKDNEDSPFGFQTKDQGKGSRLIFSDAVMIGKDGVAMDGLKVIDYGDEFYREFKALPVRQHVRINDKGTADNTGKFDEHVAYKGTRFLCEIELLSTGIEQAAYYFNRILQQICSGTFRVGSGTRNGFGLLKIVSLQRRDYNLTNIADLNDYIGRSADLSKPFQRATQQKTFATQDDRWQRYTLSLQPQDFFLFSSGWGDDEADMTPTTEACIEWANGNPSFNKQSILIPATSP